MKRCQRWFPGLWQSVWSQERGSSACKKGKRQKKRPGSKSTLQTHIRMHGWSPARSTIPIASQKKALSV